MKASYVVMLAIIVGSALGSGISWAYFSNSPPLQFSSGAAIENGPKAIIDQRYFDFGRVEINSKVRHTFQITNVGEGVLTLQPGGTTCSKCTVAQLSKTRLAKGETADVTVAFDSANSKPIIRQTAMILTNDPLQRRVELNILGRVISQYRVVPDNLMLSKISATETKTAEVKVFGFSTDDLQVVKHEFTDTDSAPYFEIRTEPISRGDLIEDAKCGVRVVLTVKPGLPLGPIHQTIRLHLNLPGEPVADVGVEGVLDSDISIVGGKGWHSDLSKLTIGAVRGSAGATHKMLILLHGSERHDVQIQPVKIEPAWLKVTLGERSELNKDVMQIPLTIEIPPGTPTENHLGSNQGKLGEITFETTHPQAKQLRMFLQFIVE